MITDRQIRHQEIKNNILTILEKFGTCSAKEISFLTKLTKYYLSPISVTNYLNELYKEGLVKRELKKIGKRRFYIYFINR